MTQAGWDNVKWERDSGNWENMCPDHGEQVRLHSSGLLMTGGGPTVADLSVFKEKLENLDPYVKSLDF